MVRPAGRLVSDRAITIAGLLILGLGGLSLVLFLAQPCTGDVLCAPAAGLLILGPPIAVDLVALLVWMAAGRVLPLLVCTVIGGLFSISVLFTDYVSPEVRPLYGVAFLAPVLVVGAVEALRAHRVERWLAVVLLGALAIALVAFDPGMPWAGGLTALVAAWMAVEALGLWRPRSGGRAVLDSAPHGGDREE